MVLRLKEPPKNLIVRMPNWVGDLVMATPLLEDLRHKFPDAEITAMCQSNVAPLLKENPHINNIYSYKRPSGWLRGDSLEEVINSLRLGDYDLGLLLTNSFSSAWWFWRGHVRNRIAFKTHWRSWFLNKAVPLPKNIETQHLVLTYKALLAPLGILSSQTRPRLYLSHEEEKAATELLRNLNIDHTKRIVGINPGAAFGSAKCWLPERFRALAQKLIDYDPDVTVLFFGDAAGAPLVNEICAGLSERIVNLSGKTSLRELIALIKKCHVMLTNDSGPMHIAAALGTPLVALFGSTNPVKTGPYPKGTVIRKPVACSPCYKRICPIEFPCMKEIEVDEVFHEILKLL